VFFRFIPSSTMSKICLVTGGNDGIGYEIVKNLAQKGHKVWLAARNVERGTAAAHKLSEELNCKSIHFVQLDVTDVSSVAACVQKVGESDHLDILINNAGIGHMDKFPAQQASKVDFKILHECFETNFFGLVQTTNAFIPLLQKSELPVIVNVTTDMASTTKQAAPDSILHVTAYNTSKAAANSYTVALAHDLPNFRINAVTPGYTATKLNGFSGPKSSADGAALIVKYALLDKDGPTSKFFNENGENPW